MIKEYSHEQIWKLYEKLPKELKEVVFAEETANSIHDICARNKIEDERISEIARYTGRVLMGLLPPDEFQEILEKELKLKKDVAKKITREINRFIFYPVKTSLGQLYKIEIAPPAQMKVTPPVSEKPSAPPGKDVYREAVEE